MKELSSPVLRQPWRNSNIENHPLSSVSTQAVLWGMMHRQRLGWCWGIAGWCDRSLFPASLSVVLYLLAFYYSEAKLCGTHIAFSLPTSAVQSPGPRRAPRHFHKAKIITEFKPSMLQLPLNHNPQTSFPEEEAGKEDWNRSHRNSTGKPPLTQVLHSILPDEIKQ